MTKTLQPTLAVITFFAGFIVLVFVLYPIVRYELSAPTPLLSPLVEDNSYTASIGDSQTNNLNGLNDKKADVTKIKYYTLSIPKLGIEGAVVAIGGKNLNDSLVQYAGTALPGEVGNTVIIGHSVLPMFFNPRNYRSIFSTVPTLQKGDEIILSYDGDVYRYSVETKFEVKPTQIEVLEQDKNGVFLSLITCVPPGDPRKPRRLIVRARLIED